MTNGQTASRIPSVRIAPDNSTVLQDLGLLGELAGTWHGEGFNLIGRPDFHPDHANVFLELNLTRETLTFEPISTSIPNRGTFQDDIELFGLTYLQKISDATTGGALHIEPGIWVTQPSTSQPLETPPPNGQLVARMARSPMATPYSPRGLPYRFLVHPLSVPAVSRLAAAILLSRIFRRLTAPPSHRFFRHQYLRPETPNFNLNQEAVSRSTP
jgi:hypothetical protein